MKSISLIVVIIFLLPILSISAENNPSSFSSDSFGKANDNFSQYFGISINRMVFIDTDNSNFQVGVANETNFTHLNTQGGIIGYNSSKNSSKNSSDNLSLNSKVTFTESGLPSAIGFCWSFWNCVQNWSVSINDHTNNATTNTLSFSLSSGTYLYTVIPPSGYSATPSSGGLLVNGNTNQDISFSKE